MHMGIFYLSDSSSNPGFPFHQRKNLCGGPTALLRPATEQVKHTGSCRTKLWCLQISSVTDLQKPAPTFKTTTVTFAYLFLYLPCEETNTETT